MHESARQEETANVLTAANRCERLAWSRGGSCAAHLSFPSGTVGFASEHASASLYLAPLYTVVKLWAADLDLLQLPIPDIAPHCLRGSQLGVAGWAAVAEVLERVTSITSLNGCDQYAAIREGGLQALELEKTDLAVWASRFLERSASSLTKLDVRCVTLSAKRVRLRGTSELNSWTAAS